MFEEDGTEYEVEVNIPPSNYLNLPMQIRERHLTQDSYRMEYEVQSIGTHLQCLLRSERDTILLRLPYARWRTGPPRSRKLNDWSLYVDRWADDFLAVGHVEEHGIEKRVVPLEIVVMEGDLLEDSDDE